MTAKLMQGADAITEAAVRLCTGDPDTLTGRVAWSEEFLAETGPV